MPVSQRKHDFAPFRKGRVAYREIGKGPVIVLLHGFMENGIIWEEYVRKLSRGFRVIVVDLPGHGATESFGYVHTMELMAQAVMAVLRHLKIRKSHLVGHSLGGYVALAFADQYPDNVKSLTLFHSTAAADSNDRKSNRRRAVRVIKRDFSRFVNEAIPALFHTTSKRPMKRLITRARKMALDNSVQGIVAAQEGMRERDDRTIIVKFAPYPVHYLIGEFDSILPSKSLLEEAAISKKTTVTEIKDCGHMGFWEKPEECYKALRKFIRTHQ